VVKGRMKILLLTTSLCLLAACAPAQSAEKSELTTDSVAVTAVATSGPLAPYENTRSDGLSEMIVAGGCFLQRRVIMRSSKLFLIPLL